jgi:hypothetical protein
VAPVGHIERKRSSGKVRHVRIIAVCAVAACAICALAAANASAALPEWGKCVKVPVTVKEKVKTKGAYANANCTEKTGGEYEFLKGTEPIENKDFTNTMTTPEAVLEESNGLSVRCTAENATGSLSGTKEVSDVRVTFTGCRLPALDFTCENFFEGKEGVYAYTEGEIRTRPLKGKLGYISGKGTATPVVGLSLTPENKGEFFAVFGCGTSGLDDPVIFSEVGAKPKGPNGGKSIISPISPVNTMGTETTQVYTEKKVANPETGALENVKGVQEPTAFENGKPDFLETRAFDGFGELEWAQSAQEETAVTKLVSGEELEIKA